MKQLLLAATAPLLLTACATLPPPAVGPHPPSASPGGPCPISSSSGWAAWINAMPGPGARPTLIVTGKVEVPTGGYHLQFSRDLRVMESYPVQVVAELQVHPPSGAATQAFVTHDVRGEWAITPPVGSLTVRCGETTLAQISPVETAH